MLELNSHGVVYFPFVAYAPPRPPPLSLIILILRNSCVCFLSRNCFVIVTPAALTVSFSVSPFLVYLLFLSIFDTSALILFIATITSEETCLNRASRREAKMLKQMAGSPPLFFPLREMYIFILGSVSVVFLGNVFCGVCYLTRFNTCKHCNSQAALHPVLCASLCVNKI